MAGISDGGNPDDTRMHLEVILEKDDAQKAVVGGETAEQREHRESIVLSEDLRADVERILAAVRAEVPGLTTAETRKLLASRAGREALEGGAGALARVDDHLQGRTRERNPAVGNDYGVFGANPTTFGGVYRALSLSVAEEARRAALPAADPGRKLLFTPYIARVVGLAHSALGGILGERVRTRAELTRKVALKDATLKEPQRVLGAVRQHLYSNLAGRKQDHELSEYGFRRIAPGGRKAKPEVETGTPTTTT